MKTTTIYKKVGLNEIKGDFYPSDQKFQPLIIFIHGGGLFWGSREDIKNEQIDFYHNAGFNLFSIDYRLAPETKLPDILSDIADCISWLETEGRKEFDYNPEKIAVIGSSAGAYLALMTGTFVTKPKAIVSFYGYGSIAEDWAIKPSPHYQKMTAVPKELVQMLISDKEISVGPIEKRYALYMYARQNGTWVEDISDLHPFIEKDELLQFCPIHHVDGDFPPTLLLHGTMDEDVPYEQSVKMHDELRKQDVSSKLITIPNGKHVFDEDWTNPVVQEAFVEVREFLTNYLE